MKKKEKLRLIARSSSLKKVRQFMEKPEING